MEKNEIDIYLHTILGKQLKKFKISNYGLYSIINNIRIQLSSIIKHWNDLEFINAIFSTVVEEGYFYEPYVNDKIGNLVVLGIRNSLLEVAASVDYKKYDLKESLGVEDIKLITSSAIEYFKDVDMDLLSTKIDLENDYYFDIVKKYDVAYSALVELGKCFGDKLEREFKNEVGKPYILDEILLTDEKVDKNDIIKDIANGISNELPMGLIQLLKGILDGQSSMIYIDSFKYLSRNFEVVLRVLQFLLTHDAMLITNNFLIKNGYVSRRKNLIRASHGDNFNMEAIKSIGDISEKYRSDLEKIMQI